MKIVVKRNALNFPSVCLVPDTDSHSTKFGYNFISLDSTSRVPDFHYFPSSNQGSRTPQQSFLAVILKSMETMTGFAMGSLSSTE